jgi:hypothetical protein
VFSGKIKRYFALAGAVALVTGGALAAAGTAQATPLPPSFTTAGVAAAAGWNVRSSTVDFTHTQGRFGSAGNASWENLPMAPSGSWAAQATTGDVLEGVHVDPLGNQTVSGLVTLGGGSTSLPRVGSGILGGIGMELCDTVQGAPGYAAQMGIVRTGPNAFKVLEVVGDFGPVALNSNGDVCDNGLLGVAKGSLAVEVKVLLVGVSANDTVDMNLLYNERTHYSVFFNQHNINVARGHITFTTQDDNTGAIGEDASIAGSFLTQTFVTNEAAQGVVADTTHAIPLSGVTVPAPNGGVLENTAPSELIRVAHSTVSGNSIAIGGHEVQGSFFTNSAWNAQPVASTSDGLPGGILYLDPSQVAADNFYVSGGIGLVG